MENEIRIEVGSTNEGYSGLEIHSNSSGWLKGPLMALTAALMVGHGAAVAPRQPETATQRPSIRFDSSEPNHTLLTPIDADEESREALATALFHAMQRMAVDTTEANYPDLRLPYDAIWDLYKDAR